MDVNSQIKMIQILINLIMSELLITTTVIEATFFSETSTKVEDLLLG